MKKKVISFSLPPDLIEWLTEESKRQRRSVSSLVAQLVDEVRLNGNSLMESKPTLPERIQAYLEKYGSATLKELKDRLRLPPAEIIGSLNKMIDHGIIERYSAGAFKTKYRVKR